MSLRVAVTGPTGDIGISAIEALEHDPDVTHIVGMARRPFDPAERNWSKTVYRQGDILDREAVDALVADVDVVVHLAFIIMGSRDESAKVNLAGTRNVFEATVAAERPQRLVYTSSVAAYGYHDDNPVPITEDVPPRGSLEHYYSEQKAACEAALAETTADSSLEVFVLRPSIVAGPKAQMLVDAMPWNQFPDPLRRVAQAIKPPFPDPGGSGAGGIDEGAFDLGTGGGAAGVHHPGGRVAALAGELPHTPVVAVELGAEGRQLAHSSGSLADQHLHGGPVAEAGPGPERVGGMQRH